MSDHERSTRSKVARLIDRYGLTGLGDELVERWTRAENRHSLRDLAEAFNQDLLAAALAEAGSDPLEGETENLYRLLTDDDVSRGVRTETENRLNQRGVDVEQLREDFVTYQAIYTYLTEYRGVEQPEDDTSDREQIEKKRGTIQRLATRLAAVTERSLTDLGTADRITLGEFDVLVNVRVHCTDCDTHASVTDLLADGGCDCARDPE